MLKRFEVENFRTCKKVLLEDLGDVVALIGRNGAGKSNVLHAIDTMAQLACAVGPNVSGWNGVPISHSESGDSGLKFTAEVSLDGSLYEYTSTARRVFGSALRSTDVNFSFRMKEKLTMTSNETTEILFAREGESIVTQGTVIGVGNTASALAGLSSILPPNHPVLAKTEPLRRFLAAVRYLPLDEPAKSDSAGIIQIGEYRDWQANYTASGTIGTDVLAQIVFLSTHRKDAFAELLTHLGWMGLGLINRIEVAPFPPAEPKGKTDHNFYFIQFHVPTAENREAVRSYDDLSQGTRRIVRLLVALAFADSPLILVEHPEDGIHKGLVAKLAGVLTHGMNNGQIVLATHSDTLLNLMDASSIRFVGLVSGGTVVRKLEEQEINAASEYICSADGSLAEFIHSVEDGLQV